MAYKETSTSAKIGVLQKITNFLLGFILSFFVSLILFKIVSSITEGSALYLVGVPVFFIMNLGLAIFILKKYQNDAPKRMIGIGVLFALLAVILLAFILWTAALYFYQGVAN